jgi:hypothetical protein
MTEQKEALQREASSTIALAKERDKDRFDFEPLREVLFDEDPEEMAQSLDEVLYMLSSLDQNWFNRLDVMNRYYDLRRLRDAIRKGGKSCQ